MSEGKHVVIVGAGVIGLCCAESLSEKGCRVSVVEKDIEANGCSYGNGGIIVPSHFEPLASPGMLSAGLQMMFDRSGPFSIPRPFDLDVLNWMAQFRGFATKTHVEKSAPLVKSLNIASRDLYEALIEKMQAKVGFEKRGLLMLCRTERALQAEIQLAEHALRLGLRVKTYNRCEVKDVDPAIEMDVEGGVLFEDDAHLTPTAFMNALKTRLISKGVTFFTGSPVNGFAIADGKVKSVAVGADELELEELILAAGAKTCELGHSLGLKLPLLAGMGYGLTLAKPPQTPSRPSILIGARVAVTPMLDGVRFVGGFSLGKPDMNINVNRLNGMVQAIRSFYPAYRQTDFDTTKVWSGNRPCAPDGLPLIGRTTKYKNVTIATGHAMMGMSLGPITGQLVSQVLSGENIELPIDLMSPDRF